MSRLSVTALSSSEHYQETMWQMNVRMEQMGPGPFPVREGQPDCSYYIQTGQCRYGAACRFNHPANRALAIAASRMKGEYPQRIGQPECQYYMKTGTCKFGATCKFHHPAGKVGVAGRVALNALGYPLRPNETECAYYMKNGECKYGSMCRFNHPQPSNNNLPLHGSSVYPPAHSSNNAQLSFALPRASYITSPQQWESPSNYAQVVMPQGVQSAPAWNTYNVGLVSSPGNQQSTARNVLNDGMSPYNEAANVGAQYSTSLLPVGYYAAFQRDDVFPERPGQLECQYYMKTGDCKFGAVCKFHHPRERRAPVPDCVLSPKGLPLRPGAILCVFYSRYGICKFGPSCKFDHPMTISVFNAATPSPNDSTGVAHFMASSSGTGALSLPPDGIAEDGTTDNRRLSLPEARQKNPHGDNKIDTE